MPASHTQGASHRFSLPAFENLQRTKPRGTMRGRAATAYGDLKAWLVRRECRALRAEQFAPPVPQQFEQMRGQHCVAVLAPLTLAKMSEEGSAFPERSWTMEGDRGPSRSKGALMRGNPDHIGSS